MIAILYCMNTYTLQFSGRLVGSIGCFYLCQYVVDAGSRAEAITRLYERYEHIHGLRVVAVEPVTLAS